MHVAFLIKSRWAGDKGCFEAPASAGSQVPRTWYSYKVAHSRSIMTFQAPPPAGRKEGFQFLAYGDMGDPHHRISKAPGCAPMPIDRAQPDSVVCSSPLGRQTPGLPLSSQSDSDPCLVPNKETLKSQVR